MKHSAARLADAAPPPRLPFADAPVRSTRLLTRLLREQTRESVALRRRWRRVVSCRVASRRVAPRDVALCVMHGETRGEMIRARARSREYN